jgi:hypothetical protein
MHEPQKSCRGHSGWRARRGPSQKQSTAPDSIDRPQLIRVTNVFHPLYGREFTLVERRSAWGEERVYFHDECGALRRLPAMWTSAAPADPFVEVAAGRSHFRIEDLLQLAALVAKLREARTPKRRRPRGKVRKANCVVVVK